jgi:epoxide hydrolase-like protein
MTATPFQISVPDDVLDDLRARLRRTLFTTASDTSYWAAGTDPGYLRELAGYWATGFDIIDKYRDWSDCGGDLESRWDKDTIATVATLYWATGTIGSSFRQYYNYDLNQPTPAITVPAAITLSNEPGHAGYVRSLAERRCTDLRHWSTPGRGGHFMAHEEPEQVAGELRTFFRPLRSTS